MKFDRMRKTMDISRAWDRTAAFRSVPNSFKTGLALAAASCALFGLIALQQEAQAMPTKTTTCLTGSCHGPTSTAAAISWGAILNGTGYPASPTALTVQAGSSFELEWIGSNFTDASHGNTGMVPMIALPAVSPTGWTITKGTAANSGITGWNTVWDATGGWNWRTGSMLGVSATFPSSPNGYSIDYSGSTLWNVAGAAYDNGSTTTPGDQDRSADKMGVDVVINVPADTPAGSYTVNIGGIGHYFTTKTAKSSKFQALTVTVTASASDTVKPVVSAGFSAADPSLSSTIGISGFAATDNTGVTGYMITTSAAAPLSTDAGWLATAPTSYTVASDGSFTLYPWAKDAAGNVSTVYGSPVTVVVDSALPTVSSTVPSSGATDVVPDSSVTIDFSEPVNCATVTTGAVTISPAVAWNKTGCSGSQAVFTPAGQAGSTTYMVTVGTGVADTAGNAMASPYAFNYTTSVPVIRPETAISAPAAASVLTTSPVAITGSASAGSNPLGSVQVSTDAGASWNAATGTDSWSYSWTLPAEDYVAHTILAKGVDDAANDDSTPASVTVRVDNAAPAGLANSAPANGAVNLATTVTLDSSAATDANTTAAVQYLFEIATDGGFTTGLQQTGWQSGTSFAPTLAAATTYYWRVKAKDAAGNVSADTATWSFSTIGPTAPDVPSASQYKADGVTPIAQGGTATDSSLVIKATVSDANSDNVALQVELITNGNSFAGVANCSSTSVASGQVATATCSGLSDGLTYKWRARASDGTLDSAWADFGAGDPDFTVALANATPSAPVAPAQYQQDGATAIAPGAAADSNVVVVGATVDGGNGDPVLLEVDLNNDGVADCASPYVTGPATANATCSGLADGSYDWRGRAKDSKSATSAWTAFTGTPDFTVATGLDFGVDATPPVDGTVSAGSGDGYLNIAWTAASDSGAGLDPAVSYKLVKAGGATAPADCSGAGVYSGNGTAYFDAEVINGSTYSYRVCAVDRVGNISAGATVSGSPSAIALPETAIAAPAAAATLTTSPYGIGGTAVAGDHALASVQVSTDNGGTWSPAAGTTSWSFDWTLPSEDYVAHTILARATDSLGYADATPAQVTVRVDNVPPAGLAASSPANGATAVALGSSLTSTGATDGNSSAAVQYFFELATDPVFSTGVQQSGWQGSTSFSPTLAPGSVYYWHARARDAAGNTAPYTATRSFASGVVAPETSITVPAAAAVLSGSPAAITGSAGAGTNPLGSVEVSTDNGGSWSQATGTGSWSYSWVLPAEDHVAHTILARALDNAANADQSPASVNVIVDTVAPSGLANSAPANAATGVATTSSLVATAATDANATGPLQYFFEIATDPGFGTALQQSGWQAGTSFAPALDILTTYYWRVRAMDAAGNSSAYSATWSFTTAAATTTVGQGTGESNVTIGPGGVDTELDSFTLVTQAGTDIVTSATVTLSPGSYAGIASITISSDGGATVHGTVSNPSSDTVPIPLTESITVTTTPKLYHVMIVPRSAAAMTAPPGASYLVTGTVTAITSPNSKAYSDTASATVTIDNLSPGNVTSAGGAAGVASNSLFWINPADSDFAGIVVLRRAGSAVADTPVEGVNYLAENAVGASNVAYVGSLTSFTDMPLTNGTAYYYRVFTLDSHGNYSAGGTALGPYTPVRTAWSNTKLLHNSTNTGSTKWIANGGWGEPGKKYGGFTCSTCHNMSSTNIKRVGASVSTADGSNWASTNTVSASVSYVTPSNGLGSDSTHAVSNRICEVCHSQTSYHRYNNPAANHNGTVSCTQCHSHSAGFKGSGGSCLACHNSPRGVRQQVVGATLGNTGDDFVRASRHIKNTSVKNVDCIICHAEGDTTSSEGSVKQVDSHMNGVVKLRNVDNQGNPGVAGTNYWNWPGRRNGGTTITPADRDNMDRFCIGCHDADGGLTIAVNSAGTGVDTGASVARKNTPFNPLDGGTPLNVKSQFNSQNLAGSGYASHHNLNIYTKRYSAAYASAYAGRGGWTGSSRDGAAMTWDTGLHCSDCHLNESNAHGARNARRMLLDKNGADAAAVNSGDGTGTFVCYRCHLNSVYNGTSIGAPGKARIEHNTFDTRPFTAGSYADRGIVCLNCHSGGSLGGIHGNNRTINTVTKGQTKSYRFMYGNELGYNIGDSEWSTSAQPTCYTASSTFGGSCSQHDGTTKTSPIGAPNPSLSRPLQ